MAKRSFSFVAVAVAVLFIALPAMALDKIITVSNNCPFPIHEIYVSDNGEDDWGDDLMADEVLGPGEAVQIRITGDFEGWDLRAVDGEGTSVDWTDLNLSNVNAIGLNSDGTADLR